MQKPSSERKVTLRLIALVGVGLIALLAAILVPVLATPRDHLGVGTAVVKTNLAGKMTATFETHAVAPTDGSGGAFGYGVMTSDGSHMIVATTHAGVRDSEAQKNAKDPVFHNHFVALGDASQVPECDANNALGGARLQVAALTFQSPGIVAVDSAHLIHSHVVLTDVPDSFSMGNALGGTMSGNRGDNVVRAVSFTLEPVFDGSGNLTNVCVEKITPVDGLVAR